MKTRRPFIFLSLLAILAIGSYAQGEWTTTYPLPTSDLRSVIMAGNQLVAIGSGNQILTSSDGLSWTIRSLGRRAGLRSIAWTGTQLVAVGHCNGGSGIYGAIFTSPDGISWTTRSEGELWDLNSISWTGSQLIAVGLGGLIVTSTDGINWNIRSMSNFSTLNLIVSTGTKLIAFGDNGSISSTDGITWSTTNGTTSYNFRSVIWTGSRFIALTGNYVYSSSDGITWNILSTLRYYFYSIIWTGNLFAGVGPWGSFFISTNGVEWTRVKMSDRHENLNALAWTGSRFVAVGDNGQILTSPLQTGTKINSSTLEKNTFNLRITPRFLSATFPISLGNHQTRAEIYAANGKKVLDMPVARLQSEIRIPIYGMAKGRYLFELKGAGQNFSKGFNLIP